MPYKELKRILFKDLKFDEKGNAIIKVPKGTTRILLQAYEEPPLTDTQFKTLLSEIRENRSSIKENTKSINEMKSDIKENTKSINEMKSDIKRNYDLIKKYHPE